VADPGVWINLVLRVGGSAVVLAIVVWPFLHEWVTHRL
jgi:hypothetical protein